MKRYGIGGASSYIGGSGMGTALANPDIGTGAGTTAGTSASGIVAIPQFRAGFNDILQGRLSLIMLDTLVLILIAFYLWTHSVQRGG